MSKLSNARLTDRAKSLRKEMTKEERHLWYDFLRPLPLMVHRQKVIGPYIVDFYIAAAQIVVELDGSQHYLPEGMAYDTQRDNYLKSLGLTVLRYPNSDIHRNFSGVCQDILDHINMAPPGGGAVSEAD